jgi:hypothetical protein
MDLNLSGIIAALGAAASAVIAYGAAKFGAGSSREKFRQMRADVDSNTLLHKSAAAIMAEKVARDEFRREIEQINERIEDTQKAQSLALEKQGEKFDKLFEGVGEIKGMLNVIVPTYLDKAGKK